MVRDFYKAIKQSNLAQTAPTLDGQEREALAQLDQKQTAAVLALSAYLDQLEDTAHILQKCARD